MIRSPARGEVREGGQHCLHDFLREETVSCDQIGGVDGLYLIFLNQEFQSFQITLFQSGDR